MHAAIWNISLTLEMPPSLILKFCLPILHYLTDLHQTRWNHWDFDLEHIYYTFDKIQYPEFRETVVISYFLNNQR